ncbi:conserved Plasmodium protein, unknown function [Plasmodium malariae]|uniref:Uncharacterized protein n=1 Tax=Plasmodium malariae TaxID=5858 RepID=A0A1A8WW25_PLAMA|nr:conserved Plasmodium protein, unknown function [Plasmodium malariae]
MTSRTKAERGGSATFEKTTLDRNVLNELKNWGKGKTLKNDEILNEYVTYRHVLNDYTNILHECKAQQRDEKKEKKIEDVANYVGLTTNYSGK